MSVLKVLPLLALPVLSFAASWEGVTTCPEAMCQVQMDLTPQRCLEYLTESFICNKTKLDGEKVITFIESANYMYGDWGIRVFGENGAYKKTMKFPGIVRPNNIGVGFRQVAFLENGSVAVIGYNGFAIQNGFAQIGQMKNVDFYDNNLKPLFTLLSTDRQNRRYEIADSSIRIEGNELHISGDAGKELVINPALRYEDVKQAYMDVHIRRSLSLSPQLAETYLRLVPRYQANFDACASLEERQVERCLARAKRPFIRELQAAMDPLIAAMSHGEQRATRAYFRKDNAWDAGFSFQRVFTSDELLSRGTTRTFMPLPARDQGSYAMTLDGLLIVQARIPGMTEQYETGGGISQNVVEWDVESNPNMELK